VTPAKLYFDEDASQDAVVSALRRSGIDVLTALEAGREGRTDDDHLRFATSLGRVTYTLNVGDFTRLHSEFLRRGEGHFGIIIIPRQRYGIGEKIRRLAQLLQGTGAESLKNSLHYL
jgi:hypothetical protein